MHKQREDDKKQTEETMRAPVGPEAACVFQQTMPVREQDPVNTVKL